MNSTIKEIITDAARGSPSGHNTQPWKFEIVNDEKVIIHPDLTKKLEVVDPENKELYISIGCLLQSFIIAASKRSIECNYEFQSEKKENEKISEIEMNICVHLKKVDNLNENPLYPYLEVRQTFRGCFTGKKIDEPTLEKLKSINVDSAVNLYSYARDDSKFETLKDYIREGNNNQMGDENFKLELMSFMRYNKGEVEKHQDGLAFNVMGMPGFPTFISKRVIRLFLTGSQQNKDDIKKIDSSSHLFLLTTKVEQDKYLKIQSWINLGKTLECFLLKIYSIGGLGVAFNNQPCEVDEILKKFQNEFFKSDDGSINEVPDILLRVGTIDKLGNYSPRKSLDKILIE